MQVHEDLDVKLHGIQGSSLAIWEIILVARGYNNEAAGGKASRMAGGKGAAAFNYARAFPEEIATGLAENAAMDFETLSRKLPQAKEFMVSVRGSKR